MKKNLTDRTLKAMKPARLGKTYDVTDAQVPGLAVRVMPSGQRTFVFVGRFPGKTNPTRRRLGTYGSLTLEKAREKARRWFELIAKGIDPASDEERLKLQEQRRRANTFAAAAEDYIRLVVIGPDPDNPRQRRGRQVERDIRRVFIPLWGGQPITEITRHDVLAVIEAVRDGGTDKMLRGHGIKIPRRNGDATKGRPTPVQARILLAYAKTLFSWAVERGAYGLEASPCDHLRSAKIIGQKKSSDRILSDDELRACWRAISRLDYPYAPLYRLLLLTGLRLNEVADAGWSEFDLPNKRWTIPAVRMKGKNGRAQPHVVPLTGGMLEVLATIPRFKQGDHLFSTTFGEKPAWVSGKVKKRVDALMLEELRRLAEERGDGAEKIKVEPWTNHDLRRTLRSGLSALRVSADVAEAVLAHVKPGIRGVYDRYDLFDEKRAALEAWEGRVRSLVEPTVAKVLPFTGRP
jgi:integrase